MITRLLLALLGAAAFTFIPYFYGCLWSKLIGLDDEPILIKWWLGWACSILTIIVGSVGFLVIHWIIKG